MRILYLVAALTAATWLIAGPCASAVAAQGEEVSHASSHAEEGHSDTAHGHGGVNYDAPPLYFSPFLLVFTLIVFGVFYVVMRNSAWGPIIEAFNEREARILRAERDAMLARSEAERLNAQADRRLAEVQLQVKEILAQARSEAEVRRQQIVAETNERALQIKDQALAEITAARQQALSELNAVVDRQAGLACQQIAGRSFN